MPLQFVCATSGITETKNIDKVDEKVNSPPINFLNPKELRTHSPSARSSAQKSKFKKPTVWGANNTDDLDDIEDEPEIIQIDTTNILEFKKTWTPTLEDGPIREANEANYTFLR